VQRPGSLSLIPGGLGDRYKNLPHPLNEPVENRGHGPRRRKGLLMGRLLACIPKCKLVVGLNCDGWQKSQGDECEKAGGQAQGLAFNDG
jgi:hypothetical protein